MYICWNVVNDLIIKSSGVDFNVNILVELKLIGIFYR